MKHNQADDQRIIANGKLVGTVIAIFSMAAAPFLAGQSSIFGYLQKMNGLYFIPIFSVVLAGLLIKRATAAAANQALVAGCVILLVGSFVPPFSLWTASTAVNFHFLGGVFVLLMLYQYLMSRSATATREWVQQDSREVELTPWRWTKPVSLGLLVFVAMLYLVFAGVPR
jgi:SSS family solute:Na+ symporter